jgi:ribonuclease P protein subunit POP4
MPITKRNILRHELIGLEARVVNSSDPNLIGISGTIIDETRNMLVIEQMERPKMVPKANSIFRITLPSGEEVEIEGAKLVARPEDRVKKRR